MLPRSGRALGQGLLGTQVVARGEVLAACRQDHHANAVVGLGAAERLVELDQQAATLCVVGLGAIEPDAGDAALVEGFVGHQFGRVSLDPLRSGFSVGLFGDCHSAHLVVVESPVYTLRPVCNRAPVGSGVSTGAAERCVRANRCVAYSYGHAYEIGS